MGAREMTRRLAALLLCLGVASAARAQARHGVQAGVAAGFHAFRDDVLVPLAFSGPRVALAPRYFAALGPGLLVTDAELGVAYVLDREGARGGVLSWALHARYLLPLYEGCWHVMLGPLVGSDNDVLVVSEWDDAHAHWVGTTWVGPSVRAWRWLDDTWRMDLSGELALVGLQSRSPSGRRPKQELYPDLGLPFRDSTRDPRLGSFLEWQVARASIDLHATPFRSRVPTGWGIGGEVTLAHATEPELAFAFTASLRASYTWGFR